MLLSEFIKKHFAGVQARFAEAQGVKKQQVTQWLTKGYIAHEWELYSKRRDLLVYGKKRKAALPLADFIAANHDAMQVKFAASEGVAPSQVTQWLALGCIVFDGGLYSPRRPLNKPASN